MVIPRYAVMQWIRTFTVCLSTDFNFGNTPSTGKYSTNEFKLAWGLSTFPDSKMDFIFDLSTEHLRFFPPCLIGYLIRFGLWEYIMNVEAGMA